MVSGWSLLGEASLADGGMGVSVQCSVFNVQWAEASTQRSSQRGSKHGA